MADTSLIEPGSTTIPVVEDNLTAKGAAKKRAKAGSGGKKGAKKPHHHHNGLKKFFKGLGKDIKKAAKFAKKEVNNVVKVVETPINKVGNRALAAWDDFADYEGKDSLKPKPNPTTANQTNWETIAMWVGLAAGGGLIIYLIHSASEVTPLPQNSGYTIASGPPPQFNGAY